MAKKKGPSFNFGANKRPKTPGRKPKTRGGKRRGGTGGKGNAWRAYTVSNAPIPD